MSNFSREQQYPMDVTAVEQSVSNEEIIAYYDTCEIDYKMLWHLNSHKAMHYGYWKEGTDNLRDALENMNMLIAQTAQIKPGIRVDRNRSRVVVHRHHIQLQKVLQASPRKRRD